MNRQTSALPAHPYSSSQLLHEVSAAVESAQAFLAAGQTAVRARLGGDAPRAQLLIEQQRVLHGLAWIATQVNALKALRDWAVELQSRQRFNEAEQLVVLIGCGEYLAQLLGGLPMSQTEFVRPAEMGMLDAARMLQASSAVEALITQGTVARPRARLADLLAEGILPDECLADPTLDAFREQLRTFAARRIAPHAHRWHLADALLPDEVVSEMADMGVFGVCIDPKFGGLGMGKLAMCVVSEELSRAWIAAGSLGTRSEIAAELIRAGGTNEQRQRWLPLIASGKVLPTAAFTEPDVGSDLASIRTRAERTAQGGWQFRGSKTWITHASRSDLMTLLARSDSEEAGHGGLSMFLVPKSRGTPERPFVDAGLAGNDIAVLGYRGMREYELALDGLAVSADALLGGVEGQGFRQLMATFESARIQTAARAVGVAWSAFDCALRYARERRQFGQAIIGFPRVSDKLALMVVETVISRELTHLAARAKDSARRCDVEAGMAKLLAARVAWSNADAAVQIHGGNGYALEFEASRILCDARVLNIFEGAAEIQAQVVGRGLLSAGGP